MGVKNWCVSVEEIHSFTNLKGRKNGGMRFQNILSG